jgi:hypothetical protein
MLGVPIKKPDAAIFLSQGAMSRRQSDKWVRLALISEALRRHGLGKASRLIQVKKQIHRFLAELLRAVGEERAHDWGDALWKNLMSNHPKSWKNIYNEAVRDERRKLTDDPVPKSIVRAMSRIHLKPLAKALNQMPIRARGGDARLSERLGIARKVLRRIEEDLWKGLLARARWRSPLLVMDEAHHLKNPATSLARQLQSPGSRSDLRTGDGAMSKAFDRMLFLTATPFQLGHRELVSVLKRFGDVRWEERELGAADQFYQQMKELSSHLDQSQRTAIALQLSWSRLRPEDCEDDVEVWWNRLLRSPREDLTPHQRSVVDAYNAARRGRDAAQRSLQPWIVRHNKGTHWADTAICRRQRLEGATIAGYGRAAGLPLPPDQLLPFFLAARSVVDPGKDLLGEALCSSYEAFRFTRQTGSNEKDVLDRENGATRLETDLSNASWYLDEFDRALVNCTGASHPKISATVRKAVDLWETGEKVLVFAFYRRTCRALRIHISREIERRIIDCGIRRLHDAGLPVGRKELDGLIEKIQKRFFDNPESPGRKAVDAALEEMIGARAAALCNAGFSVDQTERLATVIRRFLRVPTTLVRCFPIAEIDSLPPEKAVQLTLDYVDGSGLSWRRKVYDFISFLMDGCSEHERTMYLAAAQRTQTGGIRVEGDDEDELAPDEKSVVLANVQMATGATRREARSRLMRAFNTPFFPDILVCSQVMGEGVDLQRFCRHIIHHDLDWNPSTIEQRTGRIDRLGCKAEGVQPILLFLPYLAGAADERQFRVMSEREQWFRVVMGQEEVSKLITPDFSCAISLPDAISNELSFQLGLES